MQQARPVRADAGTGPVGKTGTPLYFLMFNVDAPDRVSRAVLTLANHLSLTHPVEIISLYGAVEVRRTRSRSGCG